MTTPHSAADATPATPALLQTFVRIVDAGSLSAAAAQLGTTQPTVSRRLQALERQLGVRLLHRTTHGMTLTDDGRRCYDGAAELLAGWAAFEAGLRGEDAAASGSLRVVAPHAFGQQHLVGPLVAFLQRHPALAIEWQLRDDTQSLVAEGIDCAIQVGDVLQPTHVALRLSEVERIVVASPALLRDHPIPGDPEALARLPWLALQTYYRQDIALTHADSGETRRVPIHPRLSTDSLFALRQAALLGLGACICSAWLVAEDLAGGRLVQLTPDWRADPLPVYLVHAHARHYPARLRLFIAAMRDAMPPVVGLHHPVT